MYCIHTQNALKTRYTFVCCHICFFSSFLCFIVHINNTETIQCFGCVLDKIERYAYVVCSGTIHTVHCLNSSISATIVVAATAAAYAYTSYIISIRFLFKKQNTVAQTHSRWKIEYFALCVSIIIHAQMTVQIQHKTVSISPESRASVLVCK